MPADDLETRLRNRDDLDRSAQAFEQAVRETGPASATSEGGAVTVEVDERGAVSSISVRDDWQREAEPELLAALILTALTEADGQRLKTVLEATGDEIDAPRRPRVLQRPVIEARHLRGRAGDAALRSAVDAVGGMRGMVEDLKRSMLEAARTPHLGRSSSGHARATCNGLGHLTALELDGRWLPSAHSFNIGREAREAILDAQRVASAHPMDQVVAGSRVGRLQRILTDQEPRTPTAEEIPTP